MLKHIIAMLAPLLLAGCASVPSAHLRGHYTWGHEVRSFTPCGSTQSFWVVGEPGLLEQLQVKVSEHAGTKPYQPVYVEVSGSPEPKSPKPWMALPPTMTAFIGSARYMLLSSRRPQIVGRTANNSFKPKPLRGSA